MTWKDYEKLDELDLYLGPYDGKCIKCGYEGWKEISAVSKLCPKCLKEYKQYKITQEVVRV